MAATTDLSGIVKFADDRNEATSKCDVARNISSLIGYKNTGWACSLSDWVGQLFFDVVDLSCLPKLRKDIVDAYLSRTLFSCFMYVQLIRFANLENNEDVSRKYCSEIRSADFSRITPIAA